MPRSDATIVRQAEKCKNSDMDEPPPQFLCITLYSDDPEPLRNYYHDILGLPLDYEEPGHIAAMGPVCAHDQSEGPAGTVRLYFFVDDVQRYAEVVKNKGAEGILRTDGQGKPAWESKDPFGNSVVFLTRP